MQPLTQVLSDLYLLTMTCSPLFLPSSLYLQVMSFITSLLLCYVSAIHNKHIETLSLSVLQIFFWFTDCMLDYCSFCLTAAPYACVVFWISPFKLHFIWSSCLLSDFQCLEWGHAPTTLSYLLILQCFFCNHNNSNIVKC